MSSILNNNQRKILIYRGNTPNADLSATEWLPPSQFSISTGTPNPTATTSENNNRVPISNGTIINDGTDNLTGADGGENSTDNTTRYKQGGNVVDNTAQNLNVNDTSASKKWSLAITPCVSTQYTGLWIYTASTTLTIIDNIIIKIGSDASNYYSKQYDSPVSGWNWLDLGVLEDLTETGTVTGGIDYLEILITTNNTTDVWVEGDVVFDLLRQWEESDLIKDFESGYPDINLTNIEVTTRSYINSLEAIGFNIDALTSWNKDTTKKITSISKFLPESKGDSDEFAFIEVDRVI